MIEHKCNGEAFASLLASFLNREGIYSERCALTRIAEPRPHSTPWHCPAVMWRCEACDQTTCIIGNCHIEDDFVRISSIVKLAWMELNEASALHAMI
jgi:hypothetical protein